MPPFRLSSPFLIMAAALLAVAAISVPALNGPLVLDSIKLRALEPLLARHGQTAVLHTPGFGDSMGGFNRYVAMLTFVLNIQLDGGLSPFSLKLTNFGIHAATGVLVFLLTRLLLGVTSHAASASLVAAFTAALWLLSPVNFNVPTYAVQRMAQLAAFFTLAGLCLYTAGRLVDGAVRGRVLMALAVLVCLPLAVFSKPNGALLVPLAFLVEVWFLHPAKPRWSARQLAAAAVVGVAAGLALLFYLNPGVLNYQFRDFTLAERLLSEPRALVSYLRHLVLPVGSDTAVYSDDFAASEGLLAPPSTALALLAGAAAAVFCAVSRRGPAGLAAFGLAFFGVGHALESSFVPLELYFLHRNYLPAYGIYFALACLAVLVLPNRRLAVVILSIYAVYFGALGYSRSLTWSSRENLVSAAVHYHPDSVRALSDYAQVALERGDVELAPAVLDRAIMLDDAANSHLQRLYVLCRTGRGIPDAAYDGLGDARGFGVAQELSQAQDNLLRLYRAGGCEGLQVDKLVTALDTLAPRYRAAGGNPWTVEYYAAAFLHAAGLEAAALNRLEKRLEEGHLESGLYRLQLLVTSGRRRAAARALERITNEFDERRLSRYGDAIEAFRRQVESMPEESSSGQSQ